jgi:hypothetical protein
MPHIEEGRIHGWLDGQLSAEEGAAIEAHVTGCVECAATVAEARGLIAASSRIVSALDSVPGGVLPAIAPKRRAWYASAELRAAAVIVVAGASLLVMRGDRAGEDRSGKTTQEIQAKVSMQPSAEPQAPVAKEAAPRTAESSTAPARTTAPAQKRSAASAARASGPRDAGRANTPLAAASPPPIQSKAAADESPAKTQPSRPTRAAETDFATRAARRTDSARFPALGAELGNAVVTGVVTGVATGVASAPAGFRQLRSDSVGAAQRTVFRAPSGVEVTLLESDVLPAAQAMVRVSRVPTSAPPPAAVADSSVANSITWTQKATGKLATLSGPLSKKELEALRQLLPPERR